MLNVSILGVVVLSVVAPKLSVVIEPHERNHFKFQFFGLFESDECLSLSLVFCASFALKYYQIFQ
jgi:hypothetical protein